MGVRFLFIGTLSLCLVPGSDSAQAQTASGDSEVLPAIEVSRPNDDISQTSGQASPRQYRAASYPQRAQGSCLPDRADAAGPRGN